MTTFLLSISLFLAASGLAVAWRRSGAPPESISAMVYDLPARQRWRWSAWLWAVLLTGAVPLIEAAAFLGWLTVAVLMTVAALPLVAGKSNTLHYVLGIVGGLLSQMCVLRVCCLWLLLWPLTVIALAWIALSNSYAANRIASFLDTRAVLLIEVVAATALYGALVGVLLGPDMSHRLWMIY